MRRSLARILFGLLTFFAAFGAGFLLSSDLGEDQIRREAERQLSGLLGGTVHIRQVRVGLGLGIEIEARDTTAWSTPQGPSLRADRVSATVSLGALLTGRFRLRHVALDGVVLRVDRTAFGLWRPEPVEVLAHRERLQHGPDEPVVGIFRALRGTARFLLERPLVAPQVELRRGTLLLVDAAATPGATPATLRFDDVHGRVVHHWFGGSDLDVVAVLPQAGGARVELQGRREGEDHLRLTFAATGADLAALEPWARVIHPDAVLAGEASGVTVYETQGPDRDSLELDWVARELRTAVPRPQAKKLVPIETPRAKLRALIELEPEHLRLSQGRLAGGELELDVSGAIRRPLSLDSPARIALALEDLGLGGVRSVLGWLPDATRDAAASLLDRVESGHVTRLGIRGSGRLSDWRGLAAERGALPLGFAVRAELADLAVRVGRSARLTGLRGTVEWSEDTVEVLDASARLDGEPLPQLEARVSGVSSLLDARPEDRELRPGAAPMPGLSALQQILTPSRAESDAGGEPPGARVEIDYLDHPVFLWPLENVLLAVEPAPSSGVHLTLVEGRWAGVPVRGDVLRQVEPRERMSVRLQLGRPRGQPSRRADGPGWAAGRFEIGPLAPKPAGARGYGGRFVADGSRLRIDALEAAVEPRGLLRADGVLDLSHEGEVGLDASFAWTGVDVDAALQRMDRPPGFGAGTLALVGSLEGRLLPGRPALEDLDGLVSLEARDGELQWRLPLLAALAGAGRNLFSSREVVRYKRVASLLELEQGVLHTDALSVDGPDLRMAGRGSIDIVHAPHSLDAFIGVSMLRPIDAVVEKLPLVNLLRGRDGNLVGAYFVVNGTWEDPRARLSPLRGLTAELDGFLGRESKRGS